MAQKGGPASLQTHTYGKGRFAYIHLSILLTSTPHLALMLTHVLKRKSVPSLLTRQYDMGLKGQEPCSPPGATPHHSPPAASPSAPGDGSDTWLQPACSSPAGFDASPLLQETAREAKVKSHDQNGGEGSQQF